ncbi:hypothetical protein ACWG0P_07090 [Amedibacillus sp. YH-ame6]
MESITYNGKKYELPIKTIKIAEAEDALLRTTSRVDAYEKQFNYVKCCLGEMFVDIFGTDVMNEVNLVELTYVTNLIDNAYSEKTNHQQLEKANEVAGSKAVKSIIDAGNSVKHVMDARNSL